MTRRAKLGPPSAPAEPSLPDRLAAPRAPAALDIAIAERLRTLRLARGLSQQVVAARCGLSFQQLQKYESGQNRISAARLMALAHALDVPLIDLLCEVQLTPDTAQLRERLAAAAAQLDAPVLTHLLGIAEALAATTQPANKKGPQDR